MHIADGILSPEVSIAADVIAVVGVYLGGRNLQPREIPRMGIFTAALFIVSLIHFPLAGTSVHLGLFGLTGLLFGKRSFAIVFIALLFQSLIFQHGGLLSVGVNAIVMGCGAAAGWLLWDAFKFNRKAKSFICGFFGILVPALLVYLMFLLSGYGKGMIFFVSVYLPAAVIEGLLTAAVVSFFSRVQPEILKR
jgi:cobalt/nickel transport system permease protein